MAVKIGHASLGEDGIKNNKAGDQTNKEVCTRSWYKSSWHTVLRPIDPEVAEKMAVACEAGCANKNVGYDQWNRNTLRTQAEAVGWDLSKITVPCECDCSSFKSVCAECAGVAIPYNNGNAPTTSTMVSAFKSTGEFKVLQETKYLTSDDYLKRGDVLVKKGHTVMVLEDGKYAHFKMVAVNCQVLKKIAKGKPVIALQAILNAKGFNCGAVDGSFGQKTDQAVRAFQKAEGLEVDGSVGSATWEKLLN